MTSFRNSKRSATLRALMAAGALLACLYGFPARADDTAGAAPSAAAKSPTSNAMVSLITRLAERGVLTKQDAADLISQAEADAADARVQAAEALLAAAKAEAAAARARSEAAKATRELARVQAQASSLAANQAAAVRLLTGQAGPAPTVSTAPSESSPPAAISEDSGTATAAMPESQPATQAGPAPEPTTPSMVAQKPRPTEAIAADPVTESSAAGAVAAEPAATEPTVAQAPADANSVTITRNAEGAVVVPEDAPSAPNNQSVAAADDSDSISKKSAAPADHGPDSDVAQSDSAVAGTPDNAVMHSAPEANVRGSSDLSEASGDSKPPAPAAEAPAQDNPGISASNTGAAARARTAYVSPDVANGEVRVAYVPDVVKDQIRDEVKKEVIAEARKENWGSPSSGPEWVSKFTLYGDIRIRVEEIINHSGNDNSGAFPDFNAINTGAPFDKAGDVFSPQYDVDQNRNRERFRARLGAIVDLKDGFSAEIRMASGNDDNPVTENQTFGAVGNEEQGGDFSKYELWLDRAYIKYQASGDPGDAFWINFGRFDNPFFSTSLIWANDIGFDGFAASIPIRAHFNGSVVKDFKPFLVGGAFPVYNTNLNYATNDPAKFKSYDKWLFAGQAGFDAKMGDNWELKFAGALYDFQNIQGQLSSPFTPLNSTDAGDTDASRPAFAQNGNTYMQLRDIESGPSNDNGTIDQFQYYGLATSFKELAFTEGLYYNNFEPIQISLVSEWVKNLAFNEAAVAAIAVNNQGPDGFAGGDYGWMTTFKVGHVLIDQLGAWNVSIGYRYLQSDAVVDGFNDADFGGALTGTNLKGFTLTAAVGISRGVWIEGKWFSATAIGGPVYRNDDFQLDLNARF